MTGQQWFRLALSAAATVRACGELAFIWRFSETRPAQYFKRISFAIYVIHERLLVLVQDFIIGMTQHRSWGTGHICSPSGSHTLRYQRAHRHADSDSAGYMLVLGLLDIGPIIVWVADLIWRLNDKAAMHFARWLETQCLDAIHREKTREPGRGLLWH